MHDESVREKYNTDTTLPIPKSLQELIYFQPKIDFLLQANKCDKKSNRTL